MKDKRKIIFGLICLLIIIIVEVFMYKNAYKEDQKFKANMKKFLEPISLDIEARGFVKNDETNLENGYLLLERDSNDYGIIELKYDLNGKIKDIKICLEYSSNSYSDDVFSDVYYVLSLVGIDLYEKDYMRALNILTETPSKSNQIDDEIKKSEIIINDKEYIFSLKNTKDENGEKKIQFCLE